MGNTGTIVTSDSAPALRSVTGRGVPVRGNDVDTDRIIPARYMKIVTFDGLGEHAFHDERFGPTGEKKNHPFNDPRFAQGTVLLVNRNFGCGSSREHAPQALMRWGIRAIVGESFAEIFAGNCSALGIPTVTAAALDVERLMKLVEASPAAELTVDLESKTVRMLDLCLPCDLPEHYRLALIRGTWDSTALLLANLKSVRETAERLPYMKGYR